MCQDTGLRNVAEENNAVFTDYLQALENLIKTHNIDIHEQTE